MFHRLCRILLYGFLAIQTLAAFLIGGYGSFFSLLVDQAEQTGVTFSTVMFCLILTVSGTSLLLLLFLRDLHDHARLSRAMFKSAAIFNVGMTAWFFSQTTFPALDIRMSLLSWILLAPNALLAAIALSKPFHAATLGAKHQP